MRSLHISGHLINMFKIYIHINSHIHSFIHSFVVTIKYSGFVDKNLVQLCLMLFRCTDQLPSSSHMQLCGLFLFSSLLQPWVWVGLESGRVHIPHEKTERGGGGMREREGEEAGGG